MSVLEEALEKARNLTPDEKEILVDEILQSLDSSQLTETDQAWLAEAEARYQRFKNGESKAVPLDDVLAEVRANR
jgi:putative addiction module component (TIGR02574 family)